MHEDDIKPIDFTPDELHVETEEVIEEGPHGPEVVEYYDYSQGDKVYAPGSLSDDIDLSTVGKGLFFDGEEFFFYQDTGIMATNFFYTIEGDRFYFGDDGRMVKDQLINHQDELYYFDYNGVMYKNKWYSLEEVDPDTKVVSYIDYYFGPTGRAYRATDDSSGFVIKTIEGEKYGFNSDCEKLEGFYDASGNKLEPDEEPAFEDCIYYFDPEENGAAATGWFYYEGKEKGENYDKDEEIALYFDLKTSRKVAAKSASDPDRCVSRIIDGERYMFDTRGVRRNKWYVAEANRIGTFPTSTASTTYYVGNRRYFNGDEDGKLQRGWFQAVPGAYGKDGEDLVLEINKQRHKDEEDMWFYAGSNGSILKRTIRKIGNYVYAFDDDGVMQQGALVKVKGGNYVKSYQIDDLYRTNVILDPNEYGGNADSDPNGPAYNKPFDQNKGILEAGAGYQWMYFNDEDAEDENIVGTQASYNKAVAIEFNDDTGYLFMNSTGGYTKYTEVDGVKYADVLNRNGKLIQNGFLLKPSKDTNNYGVVRMSVATEEFNKDITTTTEYSNKPNIFIDCKNRAIQNVETHSFKVVNSSGVAITSSNRVQKDRNGYYIYIGYNGEYLGTYCVDGKFGRAGKNIYVGKDGLSCKTDTDDNYEYTIPTGSYYWQYKDDKKWKYGFPNESDRVDDSYLFLNFSSNSTKCSIPTENEGGKEGGIAYYIYHNE